MSRSILMLILLSCLYMQGLAQPRIGLVFGYDISSVVPLSAHNDAVSDFGETNGAGEVIKDYTLTKSMGGFYAGLTAEFKLNKFLALQTGLQYMQKGYKNIHFWNISPIDYENDDYRLTSVECPFIFIYGTPVGSGKAFIGIGTFFSVGIAGKIKHTTIPHSTPTYNPDAKDSVSYSSYPYHQFDMGFTALLGYEFGMGVSIHVGYDLSFLQALKGSGSYYFPGNEKLSVFKFGLGYTLHFVRTGKRK